MRQLSILIYSNEAHPFILLQKRFLIKKNHKVELYTFKGKSNLIKYLKEIFKIICWGKNDFDLIHAYFGFPGWIANFQRKIPVLTTFCGSDLLGQYKKNGKHHLTHSTISKITSIFAQTFSVRTTTISQKLENRLHIKNKNNIIKLGVDSNHFTPVEIKKARKILGWNYDDIYILFPSDDSTIVKRYFIAKELISELENYNKKIHLISLNKPNMYSEIPIIMSACNAMLLVSYHEGSPNVIREAMSCNLPIFSFDIGDVEEQTLNITPGFVAKQNDKNSLLQALDEFLSKTPLARSNGRNKMISQTWENYADEIENLYYEIVRMKS